MRRFETSSPPKDYEGLVREALQRVLTPEAAREWLATANPMLDDRKPSALLAAGRGAEVVALIDQTGEGVFL